MGTILDGYAARNKKYQDYLASMKAAKADTADATSPQDAYGGKRAQDVITEAKTQVKDAQAAAVPPDTYGAVLRELARSRTQMMIRNTNGRAGSLLGIGAGDNYAGPQNISSQRLTADGRYGVQPIGQDSNLRVARLARMAGLSRPTRSL